MIILIIIITITDLVMYPSAIVLIKLEFRSVVFLWREEDWRTQRKILRALQEPTANLTQTPNCLVKVTLYINPFIPDSTKFKIDTFSKITN